MIKALMFAAALAIAALIQGCWGGGYYHEHPHICPDGTARTHRHWHADTGMAGHHQHPFLNNVHKGLSWDDDKVLPGD